MNIVCRLCRSWILRQRIQTLQPQLEKVAFAWSHDAVLARLLAEHAARASSRDLALFRQPAALRITLYRSLLEAFRHYQREYSDVLGFAPGERMAGARRPLVSKVRHAFARLDPEQRLIVALIDLGGLSYAEIEHVLAIPRARLLAQLCHARAWLKTQLFDARPFAFTPDTRALWSVK